MVEGKFYEYEIDFLRDKINYDLANGEKPSIENMLPEEELKYYNRQSLENKGLVNSDINYALQKGFRFLSPSPFGTEWNPKLKLDHVGLTVPYTHDQCLYETVEKLLENLGMPTRILIGSSIKSFPPNKSFKMRGFSRNLLNKPTKGFSRSIDHFTLPMLHV